MMIPGSLRLARLTAIFFSAAHLAGSAAFADPAAELLGGRASPYTPRLAELLRSWPPKNLTYPSVEITPERSPVELKAYATPGHPDYVGVRQTARIRAPLSRVATILNDLEGYPRLFPDLKAVKILRRDGDRLVTDWEQTIPVFFVPNIRFQMIYRISQPTPTRRIYRYQLKESKTLTASDGLIVLEAETPDLTRYTEYDFYDADWGLLKSFGSDQVWKENVKGVLIQDIAIKLLSENPEWKPEQAREEATKIAKRVDLDQALRAPRETLPGLVMPSASPTFSPSAASPAPSPSASPIPSPSASALGTVDSRGLRSPS